MTRYSSDHVWVRLVDGVATVGITDHAQAALGEITYVALKKPGTAVAQGGSLGVLESPGGSGG
jgi:glycine cleavage system H protein